MARNPCAWRLPQRVIDLKHFDYPALSQRSEFDGDSIAAMTAPRMSRTGNLWAMRRKMPQPETGVE